MDLISSYDEDEDGTPVDVEPDMSSPLPRQQQNEVATSPQAQVLSPTTHATTLIQEQLDGSGSQIMDLVMNESESNEVTNDYLVPMWLPSPTKAKCSDKQQEKINEFIYFKQRGRSFNAEMRKKKEYRNPDFLRHVVTYEEIDEIGSCFNKDVFDPYGYDKRDFYDELEADRKQETERKEQERTKTPKVEFVSGGAQSGGIPNPAVPSVTAGKLRPVSTVDSTTRNKKSKWDQVVG